MQPAPEHTGSQVQKTEYLTGEHDTADHHTEHGDKEQAVEHQHKDPHGRVSAPKDGLVPADIQNVVQNEQDEKTDTQPFMHGVSGNVVSHEDDEKSRHHHIHKDFDDLFRFHKKPPWG